MKNLYDSGFNNKRPTTNDPQLATHYGRHTNANAALARQGLTMDSDDSLQPTNGASSETNIWREDYRIRSYEVDCRNRLSILSMFSFMQEAASRHAAALGVSIQQLLAENYTWLLSRLKIKIAAYPGWNDQIQVNTWPSGTQQLFALRDFKMNGADNQKIAAAVSAWLVIDLQKRRPVRIAPFVERLKPVEGNHVLKDRLDKLPGLSNPLHEKSFVVRYSDLDINQHVNNVSYVEWIIESIPARKRIDAVLTGLEIHYLAEAFYGDIVISRSNLFDGHDDVFLHSVIKEENGQELVRARTTWASPILK